MKVLLDTNVIIDVLQKREPFFKDSNAIVLACARDNIEGFFTAKAITDIFYVMHSYYHKNELCIDIVRKLYQLFTIIDTSASACLRATFSPMSDYEDAVMDETAREAKADYIVTRNIDDYRLSSVAATTPIDLVHLLGILPDGTMRLK